MIPAISVAASDSACLYAPVSPAGPYFLGESKLEGISLLAVNEIVRTWPGGTGSYKFGLNYSLGFLNKWQPRKDTIRFWLLGDDDSVQ